MHMCAHTSERTQGICVPLDETFMLYSIPVSFVYEI